MQLLARWFKGTAARLHRVELVRWLILTPCVLVFLLSCAQLALNGAIPKMLMETRSQLSADYRAWAFVIIPSVNLAIVTEIQKDRARYAEGFEENVTPTSEPIPTQFPVLLRSDSGTMIVTVHALTSLQPDATDLFLGSESPVAVTTPPPMPTILLPIVTSTIPATGTWVPTPTATPCHPKPKCGPPTPTDTLTPLPTPPWVPTLTAPACHPKPKCGPPTPTDTLTPLPTHTPSSMPTTTLTPTSTSTPTPSVTLCQPKPKCGTP